MSISLFLWANCHHFLPKEAVNKSTVHGIDVS